LLNVNLQGRFGTALSVITAYRVTQTVGNTSAGPLTAFRQQHNLMRSKRTNNPDLRNHLL
jgi:hypothetical protein